MDKFISLFFALIISVYSGFIQAEHCLADAGLPFSAVGRAIAGAVRSSEEKKQQYPEASDFKKKEFVNDMGDDFVTSPEITLNAETWKAVEVTYISEKSYADPFSDADVDLILVGNGVKYTVPGFWNGGNEWKIRFVCPSAGEWLFKTVCTDESNGSLHGRTGKVICSEYSGEYEIYRRGFITNAFNKKYFTYDDGTPFFYLGDTHWSLGDETVDMVKTICEKRSSQGFTVIQSEPIGAKFIFENGITQDDIPGLKEYDEKFAVIAENGLVHANAEFFFPAYMETLIANMGGYSDEPVSGEKDGKKYYRLADDTLNYLEKISRYWVARYGAYPVLWTLGQEVDKDFYHNDTSHPGWCYLNNPYISVAEFIEKYDPYSHPISAHQENSGVTCAYGNGNNTGEKLTVYNKNAAPSVFRNVDAHSWYAVQWSPSLTQKCDQGVPKDYWFNSQGKPSINYEGRYCYLWTKNFGSRMQGWASYLSGMFGYGWGAHDTWSYLNIYDEQNNSSDGVDTITSEEKINATWRDALEYPCSYQVGYMKEFFTSFDWWNLIPRFDDKLYFSPDAGVYSYAASNEDNSEMVLYFYSFCDEGVAEKTNADAFGGTMTGRIGSLEPSAVYKYKWFDPSTGEYSPEYEFTSTPFGTYTIGQRMWNSEAVGRDMVFFMYK